jgi:hypothetical protein
MNRKLSLIVAACLAGSALRAAEPVWEPLFTGDSLAGWTPTPGGEWVLRDGVLLGTSPQSERRHGILLSDAVYTNFVARFQFRVTEGDSGFYFRVTKAPGAVAVKGFQAEVDTTPETGGLYETGGRAWVVKTDAAAVRQALAGRDWHDMEVRAEGAKLKVSVNGLVTADLDDPAGRPSGHLGFQLHGGMAMRVEFRRAEVQRLP